MNTLYEDQLVKMITLSEKILKIYNKIYTLEIQNKKDTKEYRKLLFYLNLLSDLEEEIYPDLSIDSINLYINLIKQANPTIEASDFNLIINDKNKLFLLKRIINRLKLESKRRLMSSFKKENKFDLYNSLLCNQFIREDLLKAFLFETETSILKTNNLEYQKALKMIKYIISYLNSSIESTLEKNYFTLPSPFFLTSKLIFSQYNLKEKSYKKAIQKQYFETIHPEVNAIGKKDFANNSYSYEKYQKILQKNLIKAYLALDKENILLSKKIYDKIKKDNEDLKNILSYQNPNLILLYAERLELYGNSKRF